MKRRGRKHTSSEGQRPHGCTHAGPLIVDSVDEGAPRRVKCLVCGTVGPERATSTEAAQALRRIGSSPRHRGDERRRRAEAPGR